jgi:hypothetical protein
MGLLKRSWTDSFPKLADRARIINRINLSAILIIKKTLTERLKLSGQINLQDLLNSSLGLGARGAVNPSLGAIFPADQRAFETGLGQIVSIVRRP